MKILDCDPSVNKRRIIAYAYLLLLSLTRVLFSKGCASLNALMSGKFILSVESIDILEKVKKS